MNDQSLHGAVTEPPPMERYCIEAVAGLYRQSDVAFAAWAAGYVVITHDPLTQIRVRSMVDELIAAAGVLGIPREQLPEPSELDAIDGHGHPAEIMRPCE